jgi:2-desacetyl-2-hydroxyethyl bacteriochlorophyllide A dehydrogenase
MTEARALQFVEPRHVEVVTVDLPEPAEDQLVVRTVMSGLSGGTEMLAYRGELDPEMPLDETLGALGGTFRYPFSYGYSCVGVVEQLGGSAGRGARGIGVEPGSLVFAFHPHQDRFVIDRRDIVPLPPGTDPRSAVLLPLVETALQLTLDAGPLLTEPVAVVGLGAVGLLTALMLQRAGAGDRRSVAADLGVDAVAPDELPAAVRARTRGGRLRLIVELSGAPRTLADALDLLAHEGTALVGSWYGTTPVPLPLGGAFHRRRLTIRASQVSTVPAALSGHWDVARRRAVALDLFTELPLAAIATTDYPFEAAAQAYAAVDRGDPGLLHVALRYE